MTRLRLGVLLALAVAFGAFSHAPEAMAAAEVHHLNLVISAMPSQLDGGGMNDLLERYNQYPLGARGFEGIDKIGMGWLFDGELRYFVRPNFALAAGVSYLKVETKREFLPSIGTSINVRGEVISVPVHVGAQYYLAPYNQGDFQARAFVGGGLLSLTSSRAIFSTFESGLPLQGRHARRRLAGRHQPPHRHRGEPGVLRRGGSAPVLRGALLRHRGRHLPEHEDPRPGERRRDHGARRPSSPDGPPLRTKLLGKDGKPVGIRELDLSGVGVRMALGIGF